jgi:hypothetical protein
VTTLANSFEGGTSGTAVSPANSGGASGNAFDAVNTGSGATLAYDSTHAAHGTLSAKIATTSSAVAADVVWRSTGILPGPAGPTWYMRTYAYLTANPATTLHLLSLTNASSGSLTAVQLTPAGKLQLLYGSAGTAFATFTAAVPLNAWFRVENMVTASAAAGMVGCSLYAGDSAVATESHTSGATLDTGTAGTGTNVLSFGDTTATSGLGPYWIDDVGVSDSGFLGPVITAAGGSAVAALVASGAI